MHQGKITMLGRIMAGSQAVIAHNEAGHGLFVASHPPDIHVSHIMVDDCHKVSTATGRALGVSARAVHAVAMARACAKQGLGLLCMREENEPAAGKTLVSWGTPKVTEAWETTEWPRGYRERRERQDNGCTRMIAHGALHPN